MILHIIRYTSPCRSLAPVTSTVVLPMYQCFEDTFRKSHIYDLREKKFILILLVTI